MSKVRKVRKLRHWKQRYDKNAKFIWRKNILWNGKPVVSGTSIPKELEAAPAKLRRFWESHIIELAEFEDPDVLTGRVSKKAKAAKPKKTKTKKGSPQAAKDIVPGNKFEPPRIGISSTVDDWLETPEGPVEEE